MAGVKFNITDRDLGLKKILKDISVMAKKPRVAVGIRGASGLAKKKGPDGKDSIAFTLVDVATVQEFGSESRNIPARAPIRNAVEKNKEKYFEQKKKIWDAVVLGGTTENSIARALGILGESVRSDIRAGIRANLPPPLAVATIERRRHRAIAPTNSTTALQDTGQLVQGMTYKVEMTPAEKQEGDIEVLAQGNK